MTSASWSRRKSRSFSAWQPLAPRCTSEMNSARNRRVLVAINMLAIRGSLRPQDAMIPCRPDDMEGRNFGLMERAVSLILLWLRSSRSLAADLAPSCEKAPGLARGSRALARIGASRDAYQPPNLKLRPALATLTVCLMSD